MRLHVPTLRVLLVPLLVGAAALAGCRDAVAPESPAAVADGVAVMAKSDGTTPFHIQQRFERAPDAETVDCGSGLTFPSRFTADGTLSPQLGRTRSLLIGRRCEVSGATVSLAGLAVHAGATGDTLVAVWIAEVDRTTGALTLQFVLVGGTGRFHQILGVVDATGEVELGKGSGWYRGRGTFGPRQPIATLPGGAPLAPETISAGRYHSCGLTPAGEAYCWGLNQYGELGDGTGIGQSSPVPVAGGLTFTQIVAGDGRTCALTDAGAAYCWGDNRSGQLGDGTRTQRLVPTPVAGGHVFKQIDGKQGHTCALAAADGRAYCWGQNTFGQLGTANTTEQSTPTAVAPLWYPTTPLSFTQISVGLNHTCGVVATLVYCWGYNHHGQLGDGSYADANRPTAIHSNYGGFVQVSAGAEHTCALAAGLDLVPPGAAYCWGNNDYFQLGAAVQVRSHPTPLAVVGGHVYKQIDVGSAHTCAVSDVGVAWCWGVRAQLGMGPDQFAFGYTMTQVRAGWDHSCGVDVGGIALCWGSNGAGQLGDGTTTDHGTPVVVAPLNLDRLSAGGYHGCALTLSDTAYCWGANYSGQLGDGTTAASRPNPATVVGGIAFHQISSGYDHSCGTTIHGVAYCWGDNSSGELGDGTTTDRAAPTPVAGGLVFARVRTGVEHSCGIANTGVAYCWGSNANGQLGDGTTASHLTPTAVSGGLLFAELAVGSYHSCALTNAGEAHCWGSDGVIEHRVPFPVDGELTFTQLSAGDRFTCGLSGGAAYCWGSNTDGQLGDGTTFNHPYPEPVAGGLVFTQLTTGESHTCGLATSGRTYCWGWNYYGQLGDRTTTSRSTPVVIPGTLTLGRISAGLHHTCALTPSGAPYCWGRNDRGQLGDGTTTDHASPRPVAGRLIFRK